MSTPPPHRNTVGVFLFDDAGRVLMQHRDDRPDITDPACWVVPGGGVDPGEALEEAARREFLEETGYRLGVIRYVAFDRIERPSGLVEDRHFYLGRYDGAQAVHCYEGQELRFVHVREALALNLAPGMAEILGRLIERRASQVPDEPRAGDHSRHDRGSR
jgi:8-oxo-dGTP pyrophosphatase MutT (NUDIX family)